jgi:hypothetical protein
MVVITHLPLMSGGEWVDLYLRRTSVPAQACHGVIFMNGNDFEGVIPRRV